MANKKKSTKSIMPSTAKKGVTKIDTIRTKKIVSKTKTSNKKVNINSSAKSNKNKKVSSKRKKEKITLQKKELIKNDEITSKTPLVQELQTAEYYDLPYTYNKTIVKILAQTPEVLFVYWDISEEDRKNYVKQYGPNFFKETKPVLIITNKTMNYTFEVDVNDFANSWYLHVNDAKCEYNIELGRRPISSQISLPNNYIHVASSNVIEAPNDHILFEKEQSMVYFKNVKTNVISTKPVTKLSFMNNLGKIYNIYDMYKKIYKDEKLGEATKIMGNSSSISK